MPCVELKNELFTPFEPSNMETDHLIEDLCKMATSRILEEIRQHMITYQVLTENSVGKILQNKKRNMD